MLGMMIGHAEARAANGKQHSEAHVAYLSMVIDEMATSASGDRDAARCMLMGALSAALLSSKYVALTSEETLPECKWDSQNYFPTLNTARQKEQTKIELRLHRAISRPPDIDPNLRQIKIGQFSTTLEELQAVEERHLLHFRGGYRGVRQKNTKWELRVGSISIGMFSSGQLAARARVVYLKKKAELDAVLDLERAIQAIEVALTCIY